MVPYVGQIEQNIRNQNDKINIKIHVSKGHLDMRVIPQGSAIVQLHCWAMEI